MMNTYVLARLLHVLGVVVWIGGVAMVTMVILPAVRQVEEPEGRVELFEVIEGRFALFARWSTILVGLSGLFMLYKTNTWALFLEPSHWWLSAMVAIWTAFSLVLFVLEPLFLHAWFHREGVAHPERTFKLLNIMHWVLLSASLITVAGRAIA